MERPPKIDTQNPDIEKKGRFAIIIPVYNHTEKVGDVVRAALKLHLPVIVVDDGSTDSSYEQIRNIKGITVLRHSENRGKGEALVTGMTAAAEMHDWAITIDADGQHDPEDSLYLIRAIPDDQRPIVVGRREGMDNPDVHWTSRFGRKFSNFWVRISGGYPMTDSQSGFRIYPLPETLNLNVKSGGYQFEIEVLVKARWRKVPLMETPVRVDYRPGAKRVSHFRPLVDFLRNSRTFSRLIVQRLFLTPSIRRRL